MLLQWFGHSSFLIISGSGTKIIMDPYEPGGFGGTFKYGRIQIAPDIVTVSHSHADHAFVEGLPGRFEVVSRTGSYNIKGIPIKGIESFHDAQYGDVRGKNIIFSVTVDKIRIAHLGDIGHQPSQPELEQLGEVDILLIPVGGHYTIGPEEADRVIERINPKIAIPMHFKTDKVEFPLGPLEDFTNGKTNVKFLGKSEFEIIKEQLPDSTEIWVLKNAL
jgi:L-ascorbate metabolism protein UlaG (beta-lactamase superfamily)